MKKILLIGILVSAATAGFAQYPPEFGLKAGVNFANLHDNSYSSTDPRTSFYLGGLMHVHLSREFALQPELMYSGQGAKYGGNVTKLNYINVPVLVQYMFGDGFRVQTGPQIGFLTNAKSKNAGVETDISGQVKKTDVAWSFGGGYLSHAGLGVDVRYNLGLGNVSKSSSDVMNRVWQLGLFYQFRH